jgi:hypothetical protein
MINKLTMLAAVFFICTFVSGQNNRINTHQTIGWYNYFGTFRLSDKVGVHTEYQWRRNELVKSWQQSLLRVGVHYQVNPRILFRAGYAWIETFPYGEIAINGFGKDFTEHRIFEMLQLSHKESIVELSHRFMLEQRLVGRYSSPQAQKEIEYPLHHRLRYMVKLQAPLKGKTILDKTPYLACYDEVFIGFGKNVAANVFDQNRVGIVLGYKFNKNIRLEAGYLNQIIQLGRQVNNRNVFQNNNGVIVNSNFNFNLSKKNG